MNNELLQKTITVASKEDKADKNGNLFFKLADENNLKYTLFSRKQDGTDTVAFKGMSAVGNILGQTVDIVYKEDDQEYEGKPYKSRTIIKLNLSGEKKGSGSAFASAGMAKDGIKTEEKKWEDINFGKCKHQFLIENFRWYLKNAGNLPDLKNGLKLIEETAEQWATMSMRKLDNIQAKLEDAGIPTIEVEDDIETYTDRGTQFNGGKTSDEEPPAINDIPF